MITISIQKAIIFATLKHLKQKRKGTEIPYIVHPMEVMQILTDLDCSENTIIAGILHDTLEDTETTPEEILNEFGEDVLSLVKLESEDKSKSWKERKQSTIEHLKTAMLDVKLICFADKLSNLRSIYRDNLEIGEKLWERFNASKEDLHWYYRGIVDVISKQLKKSSFVIEKYITEYKELLNRVFTVDKKEFQE